MNELTLHTYTWVPEPPRGFVRDLRVRWALEEAALPYRVVGVPFKDRNAEHFSNQPFGQVPWLTDGELSIFESGAILLHLGHKSDALLPTDTRGRSEAVSWLFAALNSVEMAALPLAIFASGKFADDTPERQRFEKFMAGRLNHLEPVLAQRKWLAGSFSIADILMSDVLRLVQQLGKLSKHSACLDYVARATARPAFIKAHADQMAHFAAADAALKP